MTPAPGARPAALATALAAVRARITAAESAAGVVPGSVGLVAVSKTWPASDVLALLALGIADFGENRHQDAAAKAAAVAEVTRASGGSAGGSPGAARWHFVGALQTNKAKAVAGYCAVVQSLDRAALLAPLGSGAEQHGALLEVLVQVSLDGDPARGGMPAAGVRELADAAAATPGLQLAGVMAVAPLAGEAAAHFARLREIAATVRADHPGAGTISAGMSGDLEAAVANGATLVRVGTALFGGRPANG